jgi:hypothetical protein
MKSYQEFATHLDQLLGGVHAVRITVPGYMPLSVEEIGSSEEAHRLVPLWRTEQGSHARSQYAFSYLRPPQSPVETNQWDCHSAPSRTALSRTCQTRAIGSQNIQENRILMPCAIFFVPLFLRRSTFQVRLLVLKVY